MAQDQIVIAGFAGSLRAGSYNRLLLRSAVKLAPADGRLVEIDISEIPLYNTDKEDPPPPAVARMRDAIRSADALLIVTPEYNWSMSGVTKNVIDWASRPPDDSCLNDKPVGLAGCSTGYFGTARAKLALVCRAKAGRDWLQGELEAMDIAMATSGQLDLRRALLLPSPDDAVGLDAVEGEEIVRSEEALDALLTQVQGAAA